MEAGGCQARNESISWEEGLCRSLPTGFALTSAFLFHRGWNTPSSPGKQGLCGLPEAAKGSGDHEFLKI